MFFFGRFFLDEFMAVRFLVFSGGCVSGFVSRGSGCRVFVFGFSGVVGKGGVGYLGFLVFS